MEPLTSDFSDTQINWEKTPEEIVEGVEEVFSAVKDRADSEQAILEEIWDQIEKIAEAVPGGEAMEWIIKGAAAAAFAPFAGIGAGYLNANEEIKKKRSPIAFAEGVVMGVMAENRTDFIREKFWQEEPGFYPQNEYGGQIEQYYNNAALLLGLAQGRQLHGALGQVFWSDLERAGRQLDAVPAGDDWNDWRDFYINVAGAFVQVHIPEAYG